MNNNNLMLYAGNDSMEEAMLRSVLLFNGKVSALKRQNMILKAVLAIVIYGQGFTKAPDLVSVLKRRFKVELNLNEILDLVAKLEQEDLVIKNADGTLVAKTENKEKQDFFNELDKETQTLINGVMERIEKQSCVSVSDNDRIQLSNNIKTALSSYYSMYGYKFFPVGKDPDEQQLTTAVDCAKTGLSKPLGQATVRCLADLLADPNPIEYNVLEKWARAYVAMQVMNLDPMLRNFKATKMSQKSFVIDTDVALHTITTHARFSKEYRLMADKLKDAGCKIFIPDSVVEEILDHIDAAWKWYGAYGPELLEFTDELLNSKIGNVFIEDYVKMLREDHKKRDMDFDVYINNFSDKEYPSLIWDSLSDVFGDGVSRNHFNLVPLDDEVKKKFKDKVLEETIETQKGAHRSIEKNDDIAELDTSLYLTLIKMNKDDKDEEKPLSKRTYLLTSSDRTNKCAKELGIFQKDICCDPKALLAIMQETGVLSGGKVEIINLFDNPFLVFTANEIWKEVKPILDNGGKLKHKELRRLRLDVDANIDRILTCKTQEERIAEAQRQTDRGYLFAKDLVEANNTIIEQKKTIAEKDSALQSRDEKIAELEAQLEKQKQENRKQKYQKRVEEGKNNIKKGRKTKK